MEKEKKGNSYVGYALILIILGSILISVGNFITKDLNKLDGDYIDIVAKISSYEKLNEDKVNVVCKYGYDGNEYNYICHTANKNDATSKYPLGTEEKIKINKNNPGRITILNLEQIVLLINTIGLIFLLISIIYMIKEVLRLRKKIKEEK